MLGAIIGDLAGSIWEGGQCPPDQFYVFPDGCTVTDDTVCTAAIADAFLTDRDFAKSLRTWGRRYPSAGYGGIFRTWMLGDGGPTNSYSNGGPMRVSPVALVARTEEQVMLYAKLATEVSHGHYEAIQGAQALALAILLASQGASPGEIRSRLYVLLRYRDAPPQSADFITDSKVTVPIALWAALGATSFEHAIRRAVVEAGGDADTIAAMAGALAEARFGIPAAIASQVEEYAPFDLLHPLQRLYHVCGKKWPVPCAA